MYTKIIRGGLFVLLAILCAAWLVPILSLFLVAVKPAKEFYFNGVFAWPLNPTAKNFVEAFRTIKFYMLNSLINVVATVPSSIFIAALGAFALARLRFRGRNLIFGYFMLGLMIPGFVTLLPNYILLKNVKLLDTRSGLFALFISFNIPFTIYLFRNYFLGISHEIEESAIIDGANPFGIYGRIIMPMSKPVLVIALVLNFMGVWNDLVFSMTFIQTNSLLPVTSGLQRFTEEFAQHYEKMTAGILISVFPVFILYLAFQDQIVTGMSEGAIKG